MRHCLPLLVTCVLTIAVFDQARALECMDAKVFADTPYNISVECASSHTGCYEQIATDSERQILEYKAYCAKGDECDNDKKNCLFCRDRDRCNTGLLERVKLEYKQCYSYEGGVKEEVFGTEVEHVPQVKEQPVYCLAGVSECHRIKTSKPDPEKATGRSISIMGGCDRIDCRRWQSVVDCLVCFGSLCNSLTALSPTIGIQMLSDDTLSSKAAEVVAGRPTGLLMTVAVAAAASVAEVVHLL